MQNVSSSDKKNLHVILPWAVAAVALVLYLATLNHWVSLLNLVNVGRTTGTMWQPNYSDPLFALVTYPFRLLPPGLVPISLNLFTAVCAGLTLALLTRSVILLPGDRTEAQRQRMQSGLPVSWVPLGWLPPVLAAVVCGLQLSFWEHATNASGQMFKLLLFAYVIRCLLEFRLDKRQSWLSRAAVLYGAGMANNWGMIGFFPVFIAALIWIKGLGFFNLDFLFRMAILGLVGLSVYFFIPLAQSFSHIVPIPFVEGLHNVLGGQKQALLTFPRQIFWLLSLTSLLPLLIISIRWASNLGDTSPLGQMLARLVFHVVHGAFLVACLWMMFDPGFAPRPMVFANSEIPFLTFYYLGALTIGYFSMYFLQVFGIRSRRDAVIRPPAWQKPVNLAVRAGVLLLAILAMAGLPYKNIPEIRHTNGSEMILFGSHLTENLPTNAVVLSDDPLPLRLQIAEAALARSGKAKDHLFIETRSLIYPPYHNYLHARYGTNWSETVDAKRVALYEDLELVKSMVVLSQARPVYYLHPSIGYYFEFFYGIPHGLAVELKAYPPGVIFPPRLSDAEIAENRAFWKKAEAEAFPSITGSIQTSEPEMKPSFRKFFMDKLHLKPEKSMLAVLLSRYYSRHLDSSGVEMQLAGQLEDASHYFTLALELNPGNVMASINQEFNRNLREGKKTPMTLEKSFDDQSVGYTRSHQLIELFGPVDEPAICLNLSRVYFAGGLVRQAATQVNRVIELTPDDALPRLELARIYVQASLHDQALTTLNQVESQPGKFALNSASRANLIALKASALYLKKDTDEADRIIQAEALKNPGNPNLLNSLLQVCLTYSRITNAITIADALLRLDPDDTKTLDAKATVYLRIDAYDQAIAPLNRSIQLDANNHKARLLRGIAHLGAERLDDAQRDFETIHAIFPTQIQVNFGLAEVAYRRKDTNNAIKYYETSILYGGTNSLQGQVSLQHLNELKGTKP